MPANPEVQNDDEGTTPLEELGEMLRWWRSLKSSPKPSDRINVTSGGITVASDGSIKITGGTVVNGSVDSADVRRSALQELRKCLVRIEKLEADSLLPRLGKGGSCKCDGGS